MARHHVFTGALLAAILCPTTLAQIGNVPVVIPPNFSVSLHAIGLLASGASMGTDRFGNVYIVDQPDTTPVGSVTKVEPNGTVVPQFVNNLGALSQIAYDPVDGHCYIASWSPMLPVVLSHIWRIDPVIGAVQAGTVELIAAGFTIDNNGIMFFGTQTALQGPGLYFHDPNGPPSNATFLSPGFATNTILQSLVSGDVLIAGGNEVRRWTPGAIVPAPYYMHLVPGPNAFAQVNSLGRSPFNQLGSGALIGVREFNTFCLCGDGLTISAGLTGQNAQAFATEPYALPMEGLRCIATGIFQDEWWYTDQPGPGPMAGKLLWRIGQLAAPDSQGSLLTGVAGNGVTIDVYGPPIGGDPFLLGLAAAPAPVSMAVFLPPFGVIDLFPFHPFYAPLLDGIGLFGPPNPFARIPAGGHFQLSVTVPPGLTGIGLVLQHLTISFSAAPNGLFFISNVAPLVLP